MERIVIIGAGIGGLAAAIALKQRGIVAPVFEKAPALRPIGAGITVPPNASVVLERLGLAAAVQDAGVRLKALHLRNAAGKLVQALDIATIVPEIAHPATAISRTALHGILAGALDAGQVRLNQGCTGIDILKDRVHVRFHDGSSVEAAAAIAADGLHSVVRRQVLPSSHPRYSGQTSHRGIAKWQPPEELRSTAWELWGPGIRFGLVPIGADAVYWYATQLAPAGARESGPEAKVRLHDVFRHFHPLVLQALERTPPDAIVQTDIYDYPPGRQWSAGPIALLGDAAHATTPNLGQGGAMGIEDGWFIARCLAETPNAALAFQQFERLRVDRVNEIVEASWRLGKLSETRNPLSASIRNWLMRRTPVTLMRKQYRRMLTLDLPLGS